jgi:hypothetical protein
VRDKTEKAYIILFIILGCNASGSAWYWSEYDMCTCKANIAGDRCDKCTEGFSGFPSCTAGKFFMVLPRFKPILGTLYFLLFCLVVFQFCLEKNRRFLLKNLLF